MNDLTPANQGALVPTLNVGQVDPLAMNIATSLNPSVPEQREKMLAALLGDAEDIADNLDKPLQVTDYVVNDYEVDNPATGEVQKRIRIVLFTTDGKKYQTGSIWILDSLRKIIFCEGRAPWNPGKWLVATEGKSNNKRDFYKLIPCKPDEISHTEAEEKKKGK